MKIIEPSFIIIDNIQDLNILKKIEQAGRTCYKSEDKITSESAVKFCKSIIKSGHHSVLEHSSVSVLIVCDRGVSHEIVRHRIASYSQECLTGDTIIKTGSKKKTIKYLYERQQGNKYDKTHNKCLNIKSVDEKGNIILNKMVDVFYKGKQEVYEVITKLGYKIKCTNNHRFLNSNNNFIELKYFNIGDELYVNGVDTIKKISNEELIRMYNDLEMTPIEISEELKISYRTVINRLKKIKIFVKRKNDKNKEKYFKNYTIDSYNKMKTTIKEQYKDGRTVWNKGLDENNLSVKKQTISLIKNHHNNGCGSNNSNYKGNDIKSLSGKRLRFNNYKKEQCEICGSKEKLENHHIDKNPHNWNEENKQTLCIACHNLIHHGWYVGKKTIKDKITSIKKIGIEDVYDLEMKAPYNNFIANGFVVHNSTRYCNYSKDKFGNELTFIKPFFWNDDEVAYGLWKVACETSERVYLQLIDHGSMAQEARSVLPNSLKTEIVCTFNIREWRHFFTLRCSPKAHPQMREIAIPILNKFKEIMPVLFEDIQYGNV